MLGALVGHLTGAAANAGRGGLGVGALCRVAGALGLAPIALSRWRRNVNKGFCQILRSRRVPAASHTFGRCLGVRKWIFFMHSLGAL